jgi:hypothetical protein
MQSTRWSRHELIRRTSGRTVTKDGHDFKLGGDVAHAVRTRSWSHTLLPRAGVRSFLTHRRTLFLHDPALTFSTRAGALSLSLRRLALTFIFWSSYIQATLVLNWTYANGGAMDDHCFHGFKIRTSNSTRKCYYALSVGLPFAKQLYLFRPGGLRDRIPTKTPLCRIQLSGSVFSSASVPFHVSRTSFTGRAFLSKRLSLESI